MINIIILLLLFTVTLFGSIGKVTGMMGDASIKRNLENIVVVKNISVEKNDILSTKSNAKIQVTFEDGTIITIGKNSTFSIEDYLFDEKTPSNSKSSMKFLEGTFKSITGKIGKLAPDKFKLATKTATMGIRGSIGVGSQTAFACTQGGYNVANAGVTRRVDAGMMVNTFPNQPPSIPRPFTPADISALTSGTNMQTTVKQDEQAATAQNKDAKKSSKKDEKSEKKESSEKKSESSQQKGKTKADKTAPQPEAQVDDTSLEAAPVGGNVGPDGGAPTATEPPVNQIGGIDSMKDATVALTTTDTKNKVLTTTVEKVVTAETPTTPAPTTTPVVTSSAALAAQEAAAALAAQEAAAAALAAKNTLTGSRLSVLNDYIHPDNNGIDKATIEIQKATLTQSAYDVPLADRGGYIGTDINSRIEMALVGTDTLAMVSDPYIAEKEYGDALDTENYDYSIMLHLQNINTGTTQSFELANAKEYFSDNDYLTYDQGGAVWNPKLTALGTDKLAVAWQSDEYAYDSMSGIATPDKGAIYANVYALDGTSVGENILVDSSDTESINEIAISSVKTDKLLVGWSKYEDGIYASIFDKEGAPLNEKSQLINYSDIGGVLALDKMGNDRFVAQFNGQSDSLYANVFNIDSSYDISDQTGLLNLNTGSSYNSKVVGLDSEHFASTWMNYGDIYANSFDGLTDFDISTDFDGQDYYGDHILVDSSNYHPRAPSLSALGSDKFIVTWGNYGEGTYDLYTSIFGVNGDTILDKKFISSIANDNLNNISSIALSDSKFAISWNECAYNEGDFVESDILLNYNTQYYNLLTDNSIVASDTYTFGIDVFNDKYLYFDKTDETLPYTLTMADGTVLNGEFDVYSDNLKEFMVATTSLDDDITYNDMFYAGIPNNGSGLANDKLYIYGNVAELNVFNSTDAYSFIGSEDATLLNGKLKTIGSITQPYDYYGNDNEYFYGAYEFFSASINSDGSIGGKKIYTYYESGDGIRVDGVSNITHGQLYGTQFQGIGITTSGTETEYGASTTDSITALYLQSQKDLNAKEGLTALNGFVSMIGTSVVEGEEFSIVDSGTMLMNINRDTGSIGATMTGDTWGGRFNGTLANHTSSYLSDDNFGVMVSVEEGADYNFIADSGFMVSRPDVYESGYNRDFMYENNDDESSWGYWTGASTDGNTDGVFVNPLSTWVAGVQTATSIIDTLIADEAVMTFEGNVIGGDTAGHYILLDNSNSFSATIDFGGGATGFSASMNFWMSNESHVYRDFIGAVSSTGFSGNAVDATGTLQGTYFGTGSVKSIGGSFQIDNISGVFKARNTPNVPQLVVGP